MDEEVWDEENDGVNFTVGETIAEAWWYSEGGGPVSGAARTASQTWVEDAGQSCNPATTAKNSSKLTHPKR